MDHRLDCFAEFSGLKLNTNGNVRIRRKPIFNKRVANHSVPKNGFFVDEIDLHRRLKGFHMLN